jgi:HEAT repeat protein
MTIARGCFFAGLTLGGMLLAIGCQPRPLPAAAPTPAPASVVRPEEDLRDEYLDLSAVGRVLSLPAQQQDTIWRTWASERSEDDRQRLALALLARRANPADVPTIVQAYVTGGAKARRTALRALLVFGPDLSHNVKELLRASLPREPESSATELVWTLVVAQEPRVYETALNRYRNGGLSSVTTIDKVPAFDAALLGQLNLQHTVTLAQDPDARVRRLVAQTCSRSAQTECTPWLLKLIKDADPEVSAAAAPGLAKIGSDETSEALTQALRTANAEHFSRLLTALQNEAGLTGLVAALDSVSPDPALAFAQSEQIFDRIFARPPYFSHPTALDPRGADALFDYMQHAPHIHFRTWAAITLAELGDLRAVPALATRLRLSPYKAYPGADENEAQLRRDDNERVMAARVIGELAEQHADRLSEIRKGSEEAFLAWFRQGQNVHPRGVLALAKMRSTKIVPRLRNWASLTTPLPKATEDFDQWAHHNWPLAEDSLIALGLMHDASALSMLQTTLKRRPKDLNLTMAAEAEDSNRPLRISLRLLTMGASDGLAELGDSRAFEPLFAFADDPMQNEYSRTEACRALAWVATEQQLTTVMQRLHELRPGENTLDARYGCFLEAFAKRATPRFKGELVSLLEELIQSFDIKSALLVAQALGRIGISQPDERRILALLERSDQGAIPAALALLWGARPEAALLATLRMLGHSEEQRRELQRAYADNLVYLSDEDLRQGAIYRWVANALAVEQLTTPPTHWIRGLLSERLKYLIPGPGAHPLTALGFRSHAFQSSQQEDAAAIETLLVAGEGGALLALRDTPGPASYAAYRGYLRLSQLPAVSDLLLE